MALTTALGLAQQQQQPRKIHLLHANTLNYDKYVDPDRQTLHGEVRFRQDSCYMTCDSAYFFENSNSMAAFGNVQLHQGDTLWVYCDSMFYDGNTMFGELYDHVHLIHRSQTSDTHLYTSYMTYDRELEEACYPETGVMVDSLIHLRSQIGWYYPQQKLAFFENDVEGRTYQRDSAWHSLGCMPPHDYYPRDERLHPQFILYSDTLRYDFNATLATVLGPSRIVNDSSVVHTTRGHFNTETEDANLYNHSWIESPGRYAVGDTLFYNARRGYGEAWGDVYAIDSTDHMAIRGDYAYYIENDSTPQTGFVTGHALAMEFSGADTLYLHADTLRAFTVLDSIMADTVSHVVKDTSYVKRMLPLAVRDSLSAPAAQDSLGSPASPDTPGPSETSDTLSPLVSPDSLSSAPDSMVVTSRRVIDQITPVHIDTLRYMQAYYGVRYYRRDIQGTCDSLIYSARDSLATFIGKPVMWNNQYQITGDTIFAIVTRDGIQRAMIRPNAFLTQSHDESLTVDMDTLSEQQRRTLRIDTLHYDQIMGQDLVCYFDSGHVQRLDISGNVQVINYPEEDDKSLIGLNQLVGNYLTVWFRNQKLDKLKVWPSPVGSLTPIQLVTPDLLFFDKFRWMAYLRPRDPQDVFRGIEMKAEDIQEAVKLFDDNELNGY